MIDYTSVLKTTHNCLLDYTYATFNVNRSGYAITCDVIANHLVHFVSIRLINKRQSGIDFIFTGERAIYSSFIKITVPSPVFRGKTLR